MKCEHCGKNEATFYYKSNVNGRVTEKHLCHECAEKMGYTESFRPMRLFDDAFFTRPFGLLDGLLGGFGSRMLTEFPMEEDIVHAAETEKKEEELLDGAQREKLTRECRRNALQAQLKSAVEREDFETAIKLRDEIRQLPQE
ncbi:MAG: UvrB/UvrC motif-containing protein [Clostridiales bacterium]|nr:UvrB/UvrC motif-containing protein [Candidatus Cacconaster stercorequi]